MRLHVGMDRQFLGAQTSAKPPPKSQFVANSSRWFHKISKIPMIVKIFAVLALLAHGAESVRSGSWLSEGRSLDPEKVDEKEIDEKFRCATNGEINVWQLVTMCNS